MNAESIGGAHGAAGHGASVDDNVDEDLLASMTMQEGRGRVFALFLSS
jgi:hypothetical protein